MRCGCAACSNALAAVGGTTAGPGACVVNVYINYEKKFAFVEFRTGGSLCRAGWVMPEGWACACLPAHPLALLPCPPSSSYSQGLLPLLLGSCGWQ